MATLSELITQSLNKETPGIIIPEGAEDQIGFTNISNLGGREQLLPKIKIWFLAEQKSATSQVTNNPTENGRIQNDNIILDPIIWNIRAKVTDVMGAFRLSDSASLAGAFAATLAPGAGSFFKRAGAGVSNSVHEYLMFLREYRRPFSIVTSFGKASNLFFTNLTFDRDKDTANSLPIQMSLIELFISQTVFLESTEGLQPAQGFSSIADPFQSLGNQQAVTP